MMISRLSIDQKNQVIGLLRQGIDHKAIAQVVGASLGQVAAIAAHLKMGTYDKANHPRTKTLPEKTSSPPELKNVPPHQKGKIYVGNETETGKPAFWTPTPEFGTTNPHLLIVGESGSGKTYTTQCLCAELAHVGLPTIVFDFGQGFSLGSVPDEFVKYARPVELAAGRDGININPLKIFPSDINGPLNVAQRVADSFARIYAGLGVQQHALLRDAVLQTYRAVGIDPDSPTTWARPAPRFADLSVQLKDLAENGPQNLRRYAATVASHISTVFVFNTFRETGIDLDWPKMLATGGRTFILQLKGLEHKLERVVTELLLWNLLGYLESLGPAGLRCILLLDEAHRLSFSSHSPVEKMLREGRKFGLGVVLSSQQPEDFSPVAFSNTATKLILKVSDEQGTIARALSRKLSDAASLARVLSQISSLSRGQALLLSDSGSPCIEVASMPVRVGRWDTTTNS